MSTTSSSSSRRLLDAYIHQLVTHPLRTKCITAGTLSFIQEVLASHIARSPVQRPPKDAPLPLHILADYKVDLKAFKMALYGFLVSAPLGHVLVGQLQRVFAGRTGIKARLGQILANNLVVAPILASAYLASMAVINGAKSKDTVIKTVKSGLMSVLRIQWMINPLSLVIAQKLIPQELWVPFFNMIGFTVGLYFSVRIKKLGAAQQKGKKASDAKDSESKDSN